MNVWLQLLPGKMSGDVTFPKMTSWTMESEFDQVTVPPTATVTGLGVK